MHPIFEKLGIPTELRAFFSLDQLVFYYGSDFEHFGDGFHLIPTVESICLAGNLDGYITQAIISASVMEALAYLSYSYTSYTNPDRLLVMAVGNLPSAAQFRNIKGTLKRTKITLVFGNDLLGKLCDIKIATLLKNRQLQFCFTGKQIQASFNGKHYLFESDQISLNVFEKLTGFRSGMRTRKSKTHLTYLEQLKAYAYR